MRNYFDYTTAERAAMSEEDVRALCKVALMESGVIAPTPPEPFTQEEPKVAKVTRYKVQAADHNFDALFETMEAAQVFATMGPSFTDTRYLGSGYRNRLEVAHGTSGFTVVAIEIVPEAEYDAKKLALDAWGSAKSANTAEREKYTKAQETAEKVTRGVWEDWNEQRARARHLDDVRAKYTEYLGLCDQDAAIARKFLLKVFPDDNDVVEVIGEEVPQTLIAAG